MSDLKVCVTGTHWMVHGVGSYDTAIREIVLGSRRDLVLLSYRLTCEELLGQLHDRLYDGVCVRLVIDQLNRQKRAVERRLRQMAEEYASFELYEFIHHDQNSLHAKLVMADRLEAVVGSANLSWSGRTQNYELGVRLQGRSVEQVARAVDALLNRGPLRRVVSC